MNLFPGKDDVHFTRFISVGPEIAYFMNAWSLVQVTRQSGIDVYDQLAEEVSKCGETTKPMIVFPDQRIFQ